MNVNQATVVGRFGFKPEVKNVSGTMICSFSLAVSEKWKGKDGTSQEKTDWIRCVFFGKQAEIIAQYCDKGSLLFVQGKISNRVYKDKDGVESQITEIVGREFQLGPKPQAASPDRGGGGYTAPDGANYGSPY